MCRIFFAGGTNLAKRFLALFINLLVIINV